MHSFGLTERWLVLAEFPLRGQPDQHPAPRPALHRELPLEARARHAVHADRPRHRRGDRAVRDRRVLLLPPRERLRGERVGGGRRLHVRGRADHRGPLSRPAPGGQAGRRAELRRFRIDLSSRRQVATRAARPRGSSCRGSTTAATTSVPTATSGASARRPAGSTGSSRSTSTSGATIEWREHGLLARASPCSSPRPTRRPRTTACCSRWSSTRARAARSCWCSTRPT